MLSASPVQLPSLLYTSKIRNTENRWRELRKQVGLVSFKRQAVISADISG